MADLIGGAAAVIIVRALFECAEVGWCARAAGVPCYYFIDDNFMVLREQGGEPARYVRRYTRDAVRRALRRFDGVLVATEPLREYFAQHRLHADIAVFRPTVVAQALPVRRAAPRLRIAFFGGQHLRDKVLHLVVPAVRQLARDTPTTLTLMGVTSEVPDSAGLIVKRPPYDPSYSRALSALARDGVDILVHVSADGMRNNAFKNPHALISAHALGAAPVVSKSAPYRELDDRGIALLCEDNEAAWTDALSDAAANRRAIVARLTAYCEATFGGLDNDAVLAAIAAPRHSHPARRLPRWALGGGWVAAALASRSARRLRQLARLA
ncbi:MAG TPA: hypothetical protein VEC39_18395 [Vicinamibacterales bacterium]|nr:hypothetical protein [Vicinamibacterales bacterium]